MAQSTQPVGVSIGQVFLGKYRVDSILGQGGMGVVAACTHLALDEKVAIKMLRQDVLRDPDNEERFMREAQAASKLKSEYVARVHDVGRFQNGVPYMVMEFLEGMDLDQMIHDRGHLEIPWAVELVLQTAEALAEAHSIGIVHRDVKPSNLFVTWRPDGTTLVKVLDFGISKSSIGHDEMQLTQTQSVLGTPSYMSPEQMRSARLVDARTDVWSLGTVLYEILEGRRPFEAESFSEMCVKVAVDAPGPMLLTPPAMQQIVLRCLEKSPELRYGSMAELGRDLIPFANDPHQAAALVERMHRVLRRSLHEVGAQSPSVSMAQVRAPMASGIVQELAPGMFQDGSSQFVRPVSLAIPPRKRNVRVMVIAGVLATASVLTAAIVLRNDKPPPVAPVITSPAPVVVPALVTPDPPAPPQPPPAAPPTPVPTADLAVVPAAIPGKPKPPATRPASGRQVKSKPPAPPVQVETVKKDSPKPKCPVIDPFDSRAPSANANSNCVK